MSRIAAIIARASAIVPLWLAVSSCGDPPAVSDQTGSTEQPLLIYGGPLYCGAGKNAGTGFGDVVAAPRGGLAFVPLNSLKTAPNPIFPPDPVTHVGKLRPDLAAQYIQNADAGGLQAAIQLGKALFWDIQAGSDNKTACATCHFQAGADVRTKNQLNPGANGLFDGASTNYQLTPANYPFVSGPANALTRNVDNVTGSAGVRPMKFKGVSVTNGVATESTMPSTDPVFGTMRQVTGMNTPSVINAVYNHRNFWNGRAQPEFNGVNPWGRRDTNAKPFAVDAAGNIVPYPIAIPNAALASQAVGPPLSSVEMSAAGRTFPDIGVKLLAPGTRPLGLQKVDPSDSVLGALAVPNGNGLNTTYEALIKQAFYPMWWNSAKTFKVGSGTYTLMQANFSLFWGVAIMLYEATLVSDASPMDGYVAPRFDPATGLPKLDAAGNIVAGDLTALGGVVTRLQAEGLTIKDPATGVPRSVTANDLVQGLALFELPVPTPGTIGLPPGSGVGCSFCHFGAETTSASVRNLTTGLELGAGEFKGAGFDLRMERMFMGVRTPTPAPPQPAPAVPYGTDAITYDNASYTVTVTDVGGSAVTPQVVPVKTYDVGWYNVGVRPTADNLGLGGLDFASLPLSWTEYFQKTLADPTVIKVPGGGLACLDANLNPVSPPLGGPTTPIYPAAPTGDAFAGLVMDPINNLPILSGGLSKTEATDVAGTFKTSSLRNVELNGPYFHTGGKGTLRQVVALYDGGGNFANATLAPFVRPLGLTEYQADVLVAFLLALTDDRVRFERAPFDHPSLPLTVGQDAAGADLVDTTSVQAVGAGGRATPVKRFLGLSPFQL
jgi:cytochrome c peroxidase